MRRYAFRTTNTLTLMYFYIISLLDSLLLDLPFIRRWYLNESTRNMIQMIVVMSSVLWKVLRLSWWTKHSAAPPGRWFTVLPWPWIITNNAPWGGVWMYVGLNCPICLLLRVHRKGVIQPMGVRSDCTVAPLQETLHQQHARESSGSDSD